MTFEFDTAVEAFAFILKHLPLTLFLPAVTLLIGIVLGSIVGLGEEGFEFEALQLIQAGSGKFATIDADVENLFVGCCLGIIMFQHLPLHFLLNLLVGQG